MYSVINCRFVHFADLLRFNSLFCYRGIMIASELATKVNLILDYHNEQCVLGEK